MKNPFLSAANAGIRQLERYQPGKPIEEVERELNITNVIKLASNENPLGASPHAIRAAQQALEQVHRYPDSQAYTLTQLLAKQLKISTEQIILGNGSDNVLDMVVQTFVPPETEVIISQYAFANFAITTKSHNATPVIVPADQWGHDLDAMYQSITEKTRLIFIANPNNPTGTWLSETVLTQFLRRLPPDIFVILDEAYYEYIEAPDYPDSLALQKEFPRLIVTRTFSKIYGLAGLRVGYGIATPEIIDLVSRVKLPFNISSIAQAAAVAALEDSDHQSRTLSLNRAGRDQLIHAMKRLNLPYISAIANFLTIDMKQPALPVFEHLLRRGIIVRPLLPYQMPNHLRVTIGLPDENERLIRALEGILHDDISKN